MRKTIVEMNIEKLFERVRALEKSVCEWHEWQKCPVCLGYGIIPSSYQKYNGIVMLTNSPITCPTCNGHRIISRVTGKSPEK